MTYQRYAEIIGDDLGRPEWHQHALCRGSGTSRFFGSQVDQATLDLCGGCPVRDRCAEQGRTERFGVWAGRPSGKVKIRRTPKPKRAWRGPRSQAPCGTAGGYKRHLANGEPTCAACRRFNAARKRKAELNKTVAA